MASNTFSLKIISANRVFFTGRCQSVIVPGYDGQKEVLAHHENMVIAVAEGEMRFRPEGEEEWQYSQRQFWQSVLEPAITTPEREPLTELKQNCRRAIRIAGYTAHGPVT